MKYPHHSPVVSRPRVLANPGWIVPVLRRCLGTRTVWAGLSWLGAVWGAGAAADLYLRDTPTDLGAEPNTVSAALWASDDIWVRQEADPSYQPYPAREATPGWSPLPHQNPAYRPRERFQPHYVYVRVRNRGNAASSGTERLRLYWSAEGVHPRWPDDFVNRVVAPCEGEGWVARGMEVTRVRKNAALATAEEREALVRAIVEWGLSRDPRLPEGFTWWRQLSRMYAGAPSWAHDTPAFLAWHRAFLHQVELWLQQRDPRIQLMYWDWTTDPEKSDGCFDFFVPEFMGRSGRGTAGISVGPPFDALQPPKITRLLADGFPGVVEDALILNASDFSELRVLLEREGWNKASAYVGGVGNLGSRSTAAEDPFFLFLCANADRLWAKWQRNPNFPARLDALLAYGQEAGSATVQDLVFGPWDGDQDFFPWTMSGGEVSSKTAKDASLITPPGYDTAPVVVPVLQPGEAVVLQIPWYPPDPSTLRAECDDTTDSQVGITLLARLETIAESPFGMAEPESTDVVSNVRANNNIAMKRVRVLDDFSAASRVALSWVRHDGVEPVLRSFRLAEVGAPGEPSFLAAGRVVVSLGDKLFNRWQNAGGRGTGLEILEGNRVRLTSPLATIRDIPMEPGDSFPISLSFELSANAPPQFGQVSRLDWIHLGTTTQPEAVVGGERFVIDYNRLVLVRPGATWAFWDQSEWPGSDWARASYDDSAWREGSAPLGYGEPEVRTRLREIRQGDASVTAYFRRRFQVEDPSFIRSLQLRIRQDDGVVVYLNGEEVHRFKMSIEKVEPSLFALDPLAGVNEQLYRLVNLDRSVGLLQKGENVLAVEVHQAALLNPDSTPLPDDDLILDLELSGNPPGVNQQPFIRVESPDRFSVHQAGRPLLIDAESADVDGSIRNGIFQGDNVILASFAKVDPVKLFRESFVWTNPRLGRRVVTVASFDELGSLSFVQRPILVVNNTAPEVRVTGPLDGAVLPLGAPWILELETFDEVGGSVAKVDLWVREGEGMTTPWRLLGTLFEPPYIWEAEPLPAGEYRIQAVATDNLGLNTASIPVRLRVAAPEDLVLGFRTESAALILEWSAEGVVLESADQPEGPWLPVQEATSPWRIRTSSAPELGGSAGRFFRLRSVE